MLRIRLQRTGGENNPAYRLVAAQRCSAAKKRPLEIIGHYLPTRNPAVFEFKRDRVEHYIKNGALPTDTVARLLGRHGFKDMEKFMERYTKKRKKGTEEETAAPSGVSSVLSKEDKPAGEETSGDKPAAEVTTENASAQKDDKPESEKSASDNPVNES